MGTTLAERYHGVCEHLAQVCEDAGRRAGSVRLIAVSKTAGPDAIQQAIEAGARDFGENRPERIVEMAGRFPSQNWHFIGNIQSRRIPDIVGSATLIHSLFQLRHGVKIDAAAASLGKVQDALVEVNVSGEATKSGVSPDEALDLVSELVKLENLRVRGLMTMAPQGDEAAARKAFAGLASLRDQIRQQIPVDAAEAFCELSMGMSEDWPWAVEAGATMIRVGRAIFSDAF